MPTILIGYGGYGLRVLHSFLSGAAARGALAWDERAAVGTLNERRLESLSLFWIPDTLDLPEQQVAGAVNVDGGYELMDDLYSQVEHVSGARDRLAEILADAVEREKKRLTEVTRGGVFGLDVIVIAQPTRDEVIGALRDLIEPSMARLAEDPSLASAQDGGGNSLLNFLEILDFEDYWAPRMEPVRQALHQVLNEHLEGFSAGRPTLGRVYLFDGTTPQGHRPADSRVHEAVLLLELLLLEGLRREPDAQALYRRERIDVPPVCTIGIRVVERSSGLLKRLAAASFARGWLDHLTSNPVDAEDPFGEVVNQFRPQGMAHTIGEPALRAAAARAVSNVQERFLAASRSEADWSRLLRESAEREVDAAVTRLTQQTGKQTTVLGQKLNAFRDELEKAITTCLQSRRPPWSVGAAIEELHRLQLEFSSVASSSDESAPPPPLVDAYAAAEEMQREYATYRMRQVRTLQLATKWWTIAAVVFALALSPLLLQIFSDGWPNSPVPAPVQSLVSAILAGGTFWVLGRLAIQPALERTAERARDYYTNPQRGRLSERLQKAAASPAIAGRIENHCRSLLTGLRQYLLGGAVGELVRQRTMLARRRDEMEWLQRQVGEFLLSNGVEAAGVVPVFMEGRATPDVRYALETNQDLATIAQSLPRDTGRFQELVESSRLFSDWSKTYCDTFLHPLPFLDQLSESFRDPLELDERETERRANLIATFLRTKVSMSVCFHWLATDGLPAAARWSIFPRFWKTFPGVEFALADAGFASHTITTDKTERLYLVETILGVPADLLARIK